MKRVRLTVVFREHVSKSRSGPSTPLCTVVNRGFGSTPDNFYVNEFHNPYLTPLVCYI